MSAVVESPIRVALIGLSASGGWAARSHLPAVSRLPEFRVAGVLASTPAASRAAAERYGIPIAFDSIAQLAHSDDIDLAVVAVKVPAHAELVRPLLAAGRPVYCEWPLAVSGVEADSLAALADAASVRSVVGLQARSLPAIRYLRDLIGRGAIGEVLSTTLVGSGMSWGPTTDSRSRYLRDASNGATLLSIPVGHALDALQFVLGDVVTVEASLALRRPEVLDVDSGRMIAATAADQVAVSAELESGAVAVVHYRGGRSSGTNLRWEINGTAGDILVTGDNGHLQHGRLQLAGAIDGSREIEALPVPAAYEGAPQLASETDNGYGVGNAYLRFADDLRSGTSTVPTFRHAAGRHRLLDLVTASAETGRRERRKSV